MNRKQKIIVSITGIVLASLILIGLTYAYFLTKITGNTNTKSISVSTANLVLEYGENTNVVQGIENAEPGYSVEKIFTATNKGNSTVTYGAALESIVNELSRQEDLVYTLTCTSYLKSGFSLASDGTITGTIDGSCNEVSTEKQFPSTSSLSVMATNTIDTTHTHAYKLTVEYKEMNVDQSEDMNKTFSAKVNIVDVNALTINNPYKNDAGTLKKTIIDNAMLNLNGTEFKETPTTSSPGQAVSTSTEKTLSKSEDDYGDSYYFRGNVIDNYVNYAKMCWRIVRIQGDGSIKLILEDQNKTCDDLEYTGNWNLGNSNFGYDNSTYSDKSVINYLNPVTNAPSALVNLFKKFQSDKLKEYLNYLKSGDWCYADTAYDSSSTSTSGTPLTEEIKISHYNGTISEQFIYDSFIRLYIQNTETPTNKCNGTVLNKFSDNKEMYVSTLTADEIVYAGGKVLTSNQDYYLINDYIKKNYDAWWSFSPMLWDGSKSGVFVVLSNGYIYTSGVGGVLGSRPAVQLKSDIVILKGSGTKDNPYIIQ